MARVYPTAALGFGTDSIWGASREVRATLLAVQATLPATPAEVTVCIRGRLGMGHTG